MERVDHYRHLLNVIFDEYAQLHADDPSEEIHTHFVRDEARDEYLILHAGWEPDGKKRVYGVMFHAWFNDGKLWVEQDNILPSVTGELIAHGMAQGDIVLAFYEPMTATAPAYA